MFAHLSRKLSLDRMAIGLSALCVLHCVATLLLVSSALSMGAMLADPKIHEIGLAAATLLAAVALGSGYYKRRCMRPLLIGSAGLGLMGLSLFMPHGAPEFFTSFSGLALVAIAHIKNLQGHRAH